MAGWRGATPARRGALQVDTVGLRPLRYEAPKSVIGYEPRVMKGHGGVGTYALTGFEPALDGRPVVCLPRAQNHWVAHKLQAYRAPKIVRQC